MKKSKIFVLLSLMAISLCGCGESPVSNSISSNVSIPVQDGELYVESIEIIQQPTKMKYIVNEESFDPTGMVLKAVWNDGYIEESVNVSKIYYEPYGILPEDTSYVTIYYGDASTKLNIDTNVEYDLCIIQIPVKTDYTEGEYFDPTGLILGRQVDGVKKEFNKFDINDVKYEKKPLTKSDTFVTVSYDSHSINIPIKVLSSSIKIELEDRTYVDMVNCKPKNLVSQASDGTYRYKDGKVVYQTYEEAYAQHTESAKCQMENASNGDFLSEVNNEKSKFTVKVTPDFENANLRIRGASNAVGKYDTSSAPTKSVDMDLTKIMTVKVNGVKITIDSNAIFEGITSSTPSHYVWTNWHTAYINTIKLNPNVENTIEFTFTTNSSYIHPWGSALGQYDYLLLERA